ncbi:MAG: glycosyltransferase family 2 protein [Acidobacteriota bacterium]
MSEAIKLSIIIVNWNGGELLRRCVESILRHPPGLEYEIIIADNASTDDSLSSLQSVNESRDRIRLIENCDNLGFAKANNQAIACSSSPFVFLLNPDTEVRAGAIDALVALLQSDAEIGACAPKLIGSDGELQPNAWLLPPTPLSILVEGLGLYRLLPKTIRANWLLGRHWDHSERKSVPAFSGAAMMVKRRMIEQIGAFDERFRMYGEDGEWCVRMKRNGWLLYLEPAAEVLHFGGQSAMKRWNSRERRLREVQAHILFQRSVLPRSSFLLNRLAQAFVAITLLARRFIRKRPTELLSEVIGMELGYFKLELATWLGSKRKDPRFRHDQEWE